MNNDNFDDIIKQKTDGHQAPVPPDAWNNIAKKEKKRRFVIFWWSLSSLLILGIFFICLHSTKTDKDAMAISENNTNNNSLSKPKKINSNNKPANTNGNFSNNIKDIKTQQDSSHNSDGDEFSKDITNSGKPAQTKISNQQPNEPVLNHPTPSSSTEDKIVVAVKKHSGTKKYRYSQKAKYKGNTINASVDDDAIAKTISSTGNNNSDNVEDNTIEKGKNTTTKPTQKNDITTTNTTITDQQKKITVGSSTKVKETGIGKTKTTGQNKKDTNAIKKRALVLDFSVTPFSTVQRYDQPLAVARISDNNDVHSVYNATSVQTSLLSSVAFGIAIRKNLSKKLSIGIGIQYSQIKENIKLSGIQTDTKYTPVRRLAISSTGPYLAKDTIATTTTGIRNIDAVNSYRLFSLPLFINYTFINGKIFSFGFTGGIYFTFAKYHNSIDGKLQSEYTNGLQADNEQNKIATDIFGGLRSSWFVGKKYQLFMEPNFRHNLNKYELKNTFINKNINQAGVSVGVSHKLK